MGEGETIIGAYTDGELAHEITMARETGNQVQLAKLKAEQDYRDQLRQPRRRLWPLHN